MEWLADGDTRSNYYDYCYCEPFAESETKANAETEALNIISQVNATRSDCEQLDAIWFAAAMQHWQQQDGKTYNLCKAIRHRSVNWMQ